MHHFVSTRYPVRPSTIAVRVVPMLLLLSVLLTSARPTAATSVRSDLWVANGRVYSLAVSDTTLYIGGDFTRVDPPSGSFVGLDAASGSRDIAVPAVAGPINAAAPDGQGGWYIGGGFTHVGGQPRAHLAHIRADKTLDPLWNPNPSGIGPMIFALAAHGGTVYVGGQFSTIGGEARTNLAALDATTGQASAWNPEPNGPVTALATTDTMVYASGGFNMIGGKTRNGLAALDASTGQATN